MLRILVPGAKKEDIEALLEILGAKKGGYFQQLGKDVMELLWETNGETLMEIKKEVGEMKGNVLDLFKEEIEEKKTEEKEQTATDMLKDQEPLAKIIKYSRLTEEKIRELAKKLNVAVM